MGKHEKVSPKGRHIMGKSGSHTGKHERKNTPDYNYSYDLEELFGKEKPSAPKATEFVGYSRRQEQPVEAPVLQKKSYIPPQAEPEIEPGGYKTKWELMEKAPRPQAAPQEPEAEEPMVSAPVYSRRSGESAVTPAKKKKRKKTLGERLLILIPAVAAVAAAAAMYLLVDKESGKELDAAVYQPYAGIKVSVSSGAVLDKNEDGKTIITSGSNVRELSALPLYYESKRSILLPEDMVYYAPREDVAARASALTEISCTSDGSVYFIVNGESHAMPKGYIHDGKDFYLFLEDMYLNFNGYSFELPALSYVEAVYGGEVMIYNYENGEFYMESPQTEVIAGVAAGDYTISLLADSSQRYDGMKSLHYPNPETLEPLY